MTGCMDGCYVLVYVLLRLVLFVYCGYDSVWLCMAVMCMAYDPRIVNQRK